MIYPSDDIIKIMTSLNISFNPNERGDVYLHFPFYLLNLGAEDQVLCTFEFEGLISPPKYPEVQHE